MPKQFMPDLPVEQRIEMLQNNADKVEETDYIKHLTQEEMDIRREQLSENSIQVFDLEDELATIKESFNGRIKPLKTMNRTLLTELKSKQARVSGTIYHLANHDEGMMEMYDENGDMISSRRLRPEEKQQKLFPIKNAM